MMNYCHVGVFAMIVCILGCGADDGKLKDTKVRAKTLIGSVKIYVIKNPDANDFTLEDVRAYVDNGSMDPSGLKDAWGNPFKLSREKQKDGSVEFIITSTSPGGESVKESYIRTKS